MVGFTQWCELEGPEQIHPRGPSGVNLKALNKYILEEHFMMEGFHMVRDLVRQGDWLAKIDLKDAYFLIPVHTCHQKFLQFIWKESLY